MLDCIPTIGKDFQAPKREINYIYCWLLSKENYHYL